MFKILFLTSILRSLGFQCLMYLYHYPDLWYDYAMWHAKSGSVDTAIKVFQRALKVLPGNFFFLSFIVSCFLKFSVSVLEALLVRI